MVTTVLARILLVKIQRMLPFDAIGASERVSIIYKKERKLWLRRQMQWLQCITHTEAEAGIKELQKAGFDMKKLSIVGKDYHPEEHVVGYYNAGVQRD